jgi:hypothetical protein
VCNGHTPGNYQYTTVLNFEKCCKLIKKINNTIGIKTSNGFKSDPLFLCLNLNFEGNWTTLNKVSTIIKDVFGTQLLPKKPPYRDDYGKLTNLGIIPIDWFVNKIVIITNTYLGGIGALANSNMKDVYDICYQTHKMDVTYKPGYKPNSATSGEQSGNKDWLHSYSYEMASNIGTNLSKNNFALIRTYPNPVENCNWDYDVKDPKNKTNMWPDTMFKLGSQFNLMDFSSNDENLIAYLNFFFGPGDGKDANSVFSSSDKGLVIKVLGIPSMVGIRIISQSEKLVRVKWIYKNIKWVYENEQLP